MLVYAGGQSSLYHSDLAILVEDASDLSPCLTGLLLHLAKPNLERQALVKRRRRWVCSCGTA